MHDARVQIKGGQRRRGEIISVDLSLFALLYNTNVMNKLKFNDLFKTKTKFFLTAHIFYNIQNTPLSTQRKKV